MTRNKQFILTPFVIFALLFIPLSVFAQDNVQKAQLNQMIEQGMEDWQIPGLAVVVVKDGNVVLNQSYGIRDIETQSPVNGNTLFSMASTTKALIAISIAMLVDQDKLNWEDKVRDHLPSFRLSDSYITENARVKDLLVHNLGIGSADLLWVLDSLSTDETMNRFRFAEKAYPMRGGFAYQNLMYVAAGQVIEKVSGQSWNTFIEENIFTPLEMSSSLTKSVDILETSNYVAPYFDDPEDGLIKLEFTFTDQIGPAGMLWSTANDISNYLKFLVNDGVFNGDTLVQPETFNYLFKPHALLPQAAYPTSILTKQDWNTYGLGWFQHNYRGTKLDFHTGSLPGLVAIAGLVREHNMAVYVFANLDHAELRHAIMYKAIDLFVFDDNERDWNREVFDLYDGIKGALHTATEERDKNRVLETNPTLPLDQYSGTYHHEMLGFVDVRVEENNLIIDFNNFRSFKAEHWHFDTFITTNKDAMFRQKNLLDFNLDQAGKIISLNVFGQSFVRSEL